MPDRHIITEPLLKSGEIARPTVKKCPVSHLLALTLDDCPGGQLRDQLLDDEIFYTLR